MQHRLTYFFPFPPPSRFKSRDQSESQALEDRGFSGDDDVVIFRGEEDLDDGLMMDDFDGEVVAALLACCFQTLARGE